MRSVAFLAPALACMVSQATAHTVSAGDLTIGPVWTRAAPPGASATAGYLTIANAGSDPDRLLGVEFSAAAEAGLHQTLSAGGVSAMRMVDAVRIPARQTVELKPNGFHVIVAAAAGR